MSPATCGSCGRVVVGFMANPAVPGVPCCGREACRAALGRKPRTQAQVERQRKEHRSGGRYAKVNPCQCCGKSAGVDYFSDIRPNLPGTDAWETSFELNALVLCRRCASAGEAIKDDAAALAFYRAGAAKVELKKRGVTIFAVRSPSKREEWIAYERHPIPGGVAIPILSRSTKASALADATAYVTANGSRFRADSSVVGAKVTG